MPNGAIVGTVIRALAIGDVAHGVVLPGEELFFAEVLDEEMGTMPEAMREVESWLARWANVPYAYLTTIGRQTGQPHRIEIWFGVHDGRMYLVSGGRDRSDWVRNLQVNSRVTVELGDETHAGAAWILQAGTAEEQRARDLLVGKYREGDNLDAWGRTSLPIVIEFSTGGDPSLGA
jgi:deazaflavin-dependent oxidoreductase (nitroreductase family)